MTFGLCAGPEEGRAALDAGFDYVEVPASGFGGMEATWDPAPYAGLPTPATNLFFDARVRLFGPERSPYEEYARRTVARAASLGVRTMVVGSGAARRAPDAFDGESAFVEAVAELQAIATAHGVVIAPESLNADETNVGNSLGALALGLAGRGLAYTADSYHVLREWDRAGLPETLEERLREDLSLRPAHVHVGPIDRGAPSADDPMLRAFASHLRREHGYDGTVSLEVNRGPGFDLAAANLALRALFA